MTWQDEALRLHSEGLTPVQISKKLGKSYASVRCLVDPEYRQQRQAHGRKASKELTARRHRRKDYLEAQARRIDSLVTLLKLDGVPERDIEVQTAEMMTKILVRGQVRHQWSDYELYREVTAGTERL
jgi:hypothetical protein